MLLPAVNNIAEICARHGVTEVVLSPGSRCAPLTIAFARHPGIRTRTFSDERSAAFIGLGIALTTGRAAALVCTSGTATLNYAPAVAEAFYQQVPLVIFTADRPPGWIDQLDGQTIRQQDLYGPHIKKSFSFPSDLSHSDAQWHAERMISEAINEAHAFPPGPVHLNVPLREPFYPAADEEITFSPNVKIIREHAPSFTLPTPLQEELRHELARFSKILVVAGQQDLEGELLEALEAFQKATGAMVVGDIIANTHGLPAAVRRQDVILASQSPEALVALQPELLLTFGKSIVSKHLKLYLRAHPPQAHWHLQPAGAVADTFQTLTRILRATPCAFFREMGTRVAASAPPKASFYADQWQRVEEQAKDFVSRFLSAGPFTEFTAFRLVLQGLPQHCQLHLANSMAVRYANLIGLEPNQPVRVFANRGTGGIDGSTSTAVGTALTTQSPVALLTGDLAFFYDRNALWHNYPLPNLRIVVFNNHGGGIFRIIDGPNQQPELEPYFETHQALTAELTAREFGFRYHACTSLEQLQETLPGFFAPYTGPALLEIKTDSRRNASFFQTYRQACKAFGKEA